MSRYFDEDGHFMGDLNKSPQNITLRITGGIHIHDAVLASVDITQQYKMPVCLVLNDVEVNVPYTGHQISIQNILTEYNNKVLQKYRQISK